jgi:rifampicin phosphotransferase
MADPAVRDLAACGAAERGDVGGKALALGALLQADFNVPPGFVVTTSAYRAHLAHNRLSEPIARVLDNATSFAAQAAAAEEVRQLFEASHLAPELAEAILAAHDRQRGPVAVRSSATAEDAADASFAGQQETYLWILGGPEILRHVVRCWASLFTAQAIAYRARLGQPAADAAMGVIVQTMVPAQAAGVMLTIDPVNGDPSGIVIEAAHGLGAAVVNGEVTPDRFCVDKVLLEIRSRRVATKHVAYRFDPAVQGTRLESVPAAAQAQPSVSDAEVLELAAQGKRLEQLLGRAQDIEWAIGPGVSGAREVFLLQARPETVWSRTQRPPLSGGRGTMMDRILTTLRAPGASAPVADT